MMPAMYEQCPPDSLRHQSWLIHQFVTIADSKNQDCVQIVDSLRKLLQNRCFSNRVTIFRNWHLNLRHPVNCNEEEELLIFAYSTREPLEFPTSYTQIPSRIVLELFGASNENGFELLSKHYVVGCKLKYKNSSIPIRLFTYSETMGEAQVCRLMKYLCLFDPRCHPLLILTHYWIFINNVKFSTKEDPAHAHLSLQEPLNFQWLVIHFMCYRKYIPTVREIQNRPHEILSDRLNRTDIGFFADLKYVKEWRLLKNGPKEDWGYCTEGFVLNVIKLFQDFLEFCGVFLNSGNFILNTKDGEVIEIENFLTSEPGNGWTTKMSEKELTLLKALHNPTKASTSRIDHPTKKSTNQHYATDLARWKLYMTHPFVFNWRFAIPHDIRKVLKIADMTASKLKTYINLRKSGGDQVATQMYGTLQNVLTLDKVYPHH